MNALLQLDGVAWWHVAGWTMLHYLWMGAVVGVAALVSRVALRRASANVRYVTALACLAVLAVLPVGIGIGVGQRLGVGDQVSGVGGTPELTRTPANETPAAPAGHQIAKTAGGVLELKRESGPVETALVDDPVPLEIPSSDSNPRPTTFNKQRGLIDVYQWESVIQFGAVYLPWVWIIGAPLTFLLLTTGVVGAERLRRDSRVLREGAVFEAAQRLAESLQIGRMVTIAVCERIAAPVLVGIVRPMILLPPAALTGWSPDEIEMVLLHELAHVRRWDNLVNLVQRLVEAVLFFQPAVWLVSNWVRREREACCDAVVVGRTNRPHAYAELLVALASQLPRSVLFHPAASSAMAAGPLRGRIRRILGIEDDPLLISGKSLGVVMSGLLLAATLVVLGVTTSSQAEEEGLTTEVTEGTEKEIDVAKMRAATQNNLKDLALALLNYENVYHSLPAQATINADGKPMLSWRVMVLPFLGEEEAKLFKEFRPDEPWDGEHNRKLIARMPKVFQNPQMDKPGFTNYLAVVGEECVFDESGQGIRLMEVTDGTSRTIAIVEADADREVEWTKPADWEFDRERPTAGLGGLWPNHWYAAWVDGSIQSVSNDESPDHVGIQFTRSGGEMESLAESAGRSGGIMRRGMEGGMGMRAAPAKTFPTLEEQKLADIVYRQLGLELEPLTADDLQRVRALGFDGGMKVSLNDGSVISWERNRAGIVPNDILVGLHVWPTKSAADVVAVLERDDLAELNPLKYYAVRPGEPSGGGFGPEHPEPDTVGTGRITVKVLAAKLRPTVPSSVPRQSTASGTSATDTQLATGMKEVREERVDPETGQTQTIITVIPESQPSSPAPRPTLPPSPYRPGNALMEESSQDIPDNVWQALREKGPLTVVLLYSENSEPCREMRKMLQEFERTHLSLPITFASQNVEVHRSDAIRNGIERVPTLVWLRDDEVLKKSIGAISLAEFSKQLCAVARALPEKKAVPPKLLYDGKTFDQWQSAWKTELSTEKRLEAVQALAAFGANGNGKEAAEAILEVVEQLDWTSIDDSSAGRLKQACVDALTTGRTTGGYRIKSGDWLPLLVSRLTKGSPTIRLFSFYVISQLPPGDRNAIQPLLALSQQAEFRSLALSGLKAIDPRLENSDVRACFRQALSQPTEDPATLTGEIRCLLYYSEPISGGMGPTPKLRYIPELEPLLFHESHEVRQTARMALSFIKSEDAPALVQQLHSVINDDTRPADRIEAIRALAAIGSESRPAEEQLSQIAKSQNDPARHAAALALVAIWNDNDDSFTWGDNFYERLFGGDYMQKIDYDAFQNGMMAEEKEIFDKNEKQRILGGGGGFF